MSRPFAATRRSTNSDQRRKVAAQLLPSTTILLRRKSCFDKTRERWIARSRDARFTFGSLRGGEGLDTDKAQGEGEDATVGQSAETVEGEAKEGEAKEGEAKEENPNKEEANETEVEDKDEDATSRHTKADNTVTFIASPVLITSDPSPSVLVTPPPASSKQAAKVPKSIWFFSGNHPPRPTITQYQATEAARNERHAAVHREQAAEQAQKAIEKAKRKDALKREGRLTGFLFAGIVARRKREYEVRGNTSSQPGLRGGSGPASAWSNLLRWRPRWTYNPRRNVLGKNTKAPLNLRGGTGEPRTVDPNTPLPKSLWYFAGGRGSPPTVRGWNKKYRQRRMRKKIRPGAAGEFLGVGEWGLSEESKQRRRKKGWKGVLKRLLNGGKD